MLANDESAFRAAEANFACRVRNGSSCSDPAESTRILQGLTTDDSLPFYDGYRDGGRGNLRTRDRASSPRRGSARFTTELRVGERLERILTISDPVAGKSSGIGERIADVKSMILRTGFLMDAMTNVTICQLFIILR